MQHEWCRLSLGLERRWEKLGSLVDRYEQEHKLKDKEINKRKGKRAGPGATAMVRAGGG